MQVKELIEALKYANPEFEVSITDTYGNEYSDIITVDTDEETNVYIVIE